MQAKWTCGNKIFFAANEYKIIKFQTTANYKAYVTYNQTQSTYNSTFIILYIYLFFCSLLQLLYGYVYFTYTAVKLYPRFFWQDSNMTAVHIQSLPPFNKLPSFNFYTETKEEN